MKCDQRGKIIKIHSCDRLNEGHGSLYLEVLQRFMVRNSPPYDQGSSTLISEGGRLGGGRLDHVKHTLKVLSFSKDSLLKG